MKWVCLVAALPVLASSCLTQVAAPLPADPPVVEVTMQEYSFSHPKIVPNGRVVFRVRNAGRTFHRMILVPLPKDFPPILQQIQGEERRFIDPRAGIPDLQPGQEDAFAVDLARGRYGLICLAQDPDGQTHARKGMASELTAPSG